MMFDMIKLSKLHGSRYINTMLGLSIKLCACLTHYNKFTILFLLVQHIFFCQLLQYINFIANNQLFNSYNIIQTRGNKFTRQKEKKNNHIISSCYFYIF